MPSMRSIGLTDSRMMPSAFSTKRMRKADTRASGESMLWASFIMRIEGIKTLHVDGLGGSSGGGSNEGMNGNFADGVVNPALRFRAQAPLVDQLLREIGIEGGDIQRLVGGATNTLPPAAPKKDK
jgi:Flotillin